MKETISGKMLLKEMKCVAKVHLEANQHVGCVCVGVKNMPKLKDGRAEDGGERDCYVGMSGEVGRRNLLAALNGDVGEWNMDQVKAGLELMVQDLVTFRSSKVGTAVQKKELWTTHNCAESNLAYYLHKQGVQLRTITVASYQKVGTEVSYKPLCTNCAQWCSNQYNILEDYKRANGS
jgi:hypothetical protein